MGSYTCIRLLCEELSITKGFFTLEVIFIITNIKQGYVVLMRRTAIYQNHRRGDVILDYISEDAHCVGIAKA
jgi:hypothetical protein